MQDLELALAEAESADGDAARPTPPHPAAGTGEQPADGGQEQPAALSRDELAAQVTAGRNAEMDARLEVRTAEERLRAIAGRADALVATAAAERQAAQAAQARRIRRERQAVVARAVAEGAAQALARLTESLTLASAQRQAAEHASKGRAVALKEIRGTVRDLAAEFDRVVDAAHGTEMARAEHRMRLEQLAARAADEFGVTDAALVAEYGPEVPVPVISPDAPEQAAGPAEAAGAATGRAPARANGAGPAGAAGRFPTTPVPSTAAARPKTLSWPTPLSWPPGPLPRPREEQPVLVGTIPYVRSEQERRAAAAQRQLDQLGKVNPLALEEFAALEERHAFLATQLEDLKKTRRDLLTVVKEVDDRVQQVFASALRGHRTRVREHLWRGCSPAARAGWILTEPDDMLATGIDVEARPPGKKVKRLSLLSGGERSLTAIAFLRGHLQGPAVAVLRAGRGRGGARRHEPAAPAAHLRGAEVGLPAASSSPTRSGPWRSRTRCTASACAATAYPPWSASASASASPPDRLTG